MNAQQKKLQRLVAKLLKSGYTQTTLAKKVGVGQMTISRWLNNPPEEPKASSLLKLESLIEKKE